jgi:hypothetical protein
MFRVKQILQLVFVFAIAAVEFARVENIPWD